jgi:hypothetical protein
VFLFLNVLLFAAAKDSLKASEGQPVFSRITTIHNDTLFCYVEYHEYIKEYVSVGKFNSIIYCYNPRFPYKERLRINTSEIKFMSIAHDQYVRILDAKESAGILAKLVVEGSTNLYHYQLDDFKDMKMRDSSYSSSLGFTVTKYDFLILQNRNSSFNIFDLTNSHRELTNHLLSENFHYIFHEDEMKLELSLLVKRCSDLKINTLPTSYHLKEMKAFVTLTNTCK